MSDILFCGTAVAEAAPPAAHAAQALAVPVHCGMPMEWKAPAPALMSFYSFAPADACAELPPLWRCGCGFQVDGIGQAPSIVSELSR